VNNEAYSIALQNALTEIKNICPDVNTSFLFDKEGSIIAGDDETQEVSLEKTVSSMEGIFNKAETIGDLDVLVVNGRKGKVHISCVNDMYLAMVTTKNADMTYLQTVSRVLIPTVIKLLDNIAPTPIRSSFSKPPLLHPPRRDMREEIEEAQDEIEEAIDEETIDEEAIDEETIEEEITRPERVKRDLSETVSAPSHQLVVDILSGLLVRGDTVQIDPEILSKWSEFYDGTDINIVEIETFNGNATQCKVKPIKDSKLEGKGVIRIPERACQDLDVKKGELVKVKPWVEEG